VRLLLDFFFFLIFEFVDVAWNFAVVFVQAFRTPSLSFGLLRRSKIENGFVHVILDEVLRLALL